MISILWLIPTFAVGIVVGVVIMACAAMASRDDDDMMRWNAELPDA